MDLLLLVGLSIPFWLDIFYPMGTALATGEFKLNRTAALKMASRPSCKRAWDTALNIAACICVGGCIVFLSFGSGKEIRLDMEGDDVSGKHHTRVPLETPIG